MAVWNWGDGEIENPRILRDQLTDIQAGGFSDVLVTLRGSRYEILDPKVVRAAAQASQWVKARGMAFWIGADPARASRTLIAQTGERLQCLLYSGARTGEPASLTRVSEGRFNISLDFQESRNRSAGRDRTLRLDPVGLERVFLFQMENGQIIKDSLIDITAASRFFVNPEENTVEIFGEVGMPDHQEWQVIAFAKFNTDLYDFAGRESIDALRKFADALFDAAAYVDGMVWDETSLSFGPLLPVSDSIYNAFRFQYDRDLRDSLFALVLDVDDGSHIPVRYTYCRFLADTVYTAQKDAYAFFHTYFGELGSSMPVVWRRQSGPRSLFMAESPDPWLNLDGPGVAIGEMHWPSGDQSLTDTLLTQLCMMRSLGALSKAQTAFAALNGGWPSDGACLFWLDLLCLFSIHWLYRPENGNGRIGQLSLSAADSKETPSWNARFDRIEKITGYRFPPADMAVILPTDTLWTVGTEIADEIRSAFSGLIGRLFRAGFQPDIVSSSLFDRARLTGDGIRIGVRTYRSVTYPYPLVMSPQALDMISMMDRLNYPVLLGGAEPEYTTTGERIPHVFPMHFEPESEDLSAFLAAGVRKPFDLPAGAIAAAVVNLQDRLVLVAPDRPGRRVDGTLHVEGIGIRLEGLDRLAIFKLDGPEKTVRVF